MYLNKRSGGVKARDDKLACDILYFGLDLRAHVQLMAVKFDLVDVCHEFVTRPVFWASLQKINLR